MQTNRSTLFAGLALAIGILVLAACQPVAPAGDTAGEPAEAAAHTPAVTVEDQAIADGTVTVAEVVSSGPGWIVIHTQADGKPGPIIGYEAVGDGSNQNVKVEVDAGAATDTLYAMLHTDAGEAGTWEFPDGADVPVKDGDGNVITPPFSVLAGEAASEQAEAPVLAAGGSDDLGEFLVDGQGMTLYLFLNDEPGVSNCYNGCAQKWPPLIVEGDVSVGDGVDAALVGTTERTDGSMQVTYNDWPLYYWQKDAAPGDTLGQDVGEVWYVISPAGEAVH